MDSESLLPSALEQLSRETFVRSVEYHSCLESTQVRAIECAGDSGALLPLMVVASHQTSGRGRGARRWWASPGALTFSLVIDSRTVPAVDARLSVVTALAVRDVLAEIHPSGRFQVKWPNDLFVDGKKIAGILLDRPTSASDWIVVGIGINVNNSLDAAPPDVRACATSLIDEAHRPFLLHDILKQILLRLDPMWHDYAEGRLDLPESWLPHCRLQGRRVVVMQGRRRVEGVCHGIDAMGNLLVDGPGGLVALASGTITEG